MNSDASKQSSQSTFRSPTLMNANDTALFIIDVQEKLMPLIEGEQRIQWNISRLIAGADLLGVRIVVTEQYPKGLGPTIAPLVESLTTAKAEPAVEKIMFSCRECSTVVAQLADAGITNLLLTGIETHVCVAQTALDLISAGFNVFICLDAIGSRGALDHQTAIRRMENAGVVPTTTEAALFEWCEKAGTQQFKKISELVK